VCKPKTTNKYTTPVTTTREPITDHTVKTLYADCAEELYTVFRIIKKAGTNNNSYPITKPTIFVVLIKNKTIKNKKIKFNEQKNTLNFSFRTSKTKVIGVINKKSSKKTESAI
jgi:hypothetical protein